MSPVLVEANLDAGCPAPRLFTWVGDLAQYPAWLDLVRNVEQSASGPDGLDAWDIVLSARVGPLRRSKRLRMVRTLHEAPAAGGTHRVRFERRELDGRDHAAWVLDASVEPVVPAGSRLVMTLGYEGRLWGPLLEPVLAEQIAVGRRNLASLAASPT